MESSWDYLSCVICQVICEDVERLNCCKKLICDSCISKLKKKCCPHCNHERLDYFKDDIVIGFISSTSQKCSSCMKNILLKDLEEHLQNCKKTVKCKICKISMQEYEIKDHVYNKHFPFFEKAFLETEVPVTMKVPKNVKVYSEEVKNDAGVLATKSSVNGKYYCHSEIEYQTNHRLLPEKCEPNGLNCRNCMKLDLESRNIEMLVLINSAGRESQIELDSFQFSCFTEIELDGKKTLCKGRINCKECKALAIMLKDMDDEFPYFSLMITE